MSLTPSRTSGQIVGLPNTTPLFRKLPPPQPTRSFPVLTHQRRNDRLQCTSINQSGSPINETSKGDSKVTKINKRTGPFIKINLDFYSVLKARMFNSTEILQRSFDNLVKFVPDKRYSKETLEGRQVILQKAADTMLDSDKRREYDQKLAENKVPSISVQDKHFSGALLLLHESSEIEQIIELGTQWLNKNGVSESSRDIALTMAKAYCDLAGITLDSGDGIALCCEELDTALELLKICNVAPDLQSEITQTLMELRPQYILELLALVDDDPEVLDQREEGINQLKDLLWEVDPQGVLSPGLEDRQGFLEKARTHLTAAQQIEVFESCPKEVEVVPQEELYDSAMAYVAEGYRRKWPQHIQKAERVLKQIQIDSIRSDFKSTDVSVELALCALLLGHTERSMLTLGLTPGSPRVPDPEIIAFVKSHSDSEDDLLPGVCALAEVWLKDTIIPKYKEINTMTSSLGEWFQSPTVSVYLRVLEQGKEMSLNSAIEFSSSLVKVITSVLTKALQGVKKTIKKPLNIIQDDSESVGRLKFTKIDKTRISQSEMSDDWWNESEEKVKRIQEDEVGEDSFFKSFWKPFLFTSMIVFLAGIGRFMIIDSDLKLKPNITTNLTKIIQDIKVNKKSLNFLTCFSRILISVKYKELLMLRRLKR